MNPEEEYGMLGELEHILTRPDMYVGSVDPEERTVMIIRFSKKSDKFKIVERDISYNEGMERLFLELISNAADNARKSREMGIAPGRMSVSIDGTTISVYNEGRPISTQWHSKHLMWIPEMIFSHLRAGSNFDDSKDRKFAGRNGLGAKLCAAFSKSFKIDIQNANEGIRYQQEFKNNLSERCPAIREKIDPATDISTEGSYTRISYDLDFKRFYAGGLAREKDHNFKLPITDNPLHCQLCWEELKGPQSEKPTKFEGSAEAHQSTLPLTNDPLHCALCWDHNKGDETHAVYSEDFIGLIARITLDFAFNCNIPITFSINDREYNFDLSSPLSFATAYMPEITNIKSSPIIYESRDGDTRLVMVDTPHNGQIISFANGMPTRLGGVHVNEWLNAFTEKLKKDLEKQFKFRINVSHVKAHVTMILSVYVVNPKFDGQTKERLKDPKPVVYVSEQHLKIFEGWQAVKAIRESVEKSAKNKVSKLTAGKKVSFVMIPGADDAGQAGKELSAKCTAFLVEGLSAKTFFVDGMKFAKGGRELNGCYPLRGKVLNTRQAKSEKIMTNKVVTDINTFLGLRDDLDYSNPKSMNTLRYGKAMILVDADDDGIHIKGLLLNHFSRYKGLLESGYVEARLNPVLLAIKGKLRHKFYSTAEYERWCKRTPNASAYSVEYFKGLGTATEQMVKDCFAAPVTQTFQCGTQDHEALELAFGGGTAEARKQLYRILIGLPEELRMDSSRVHKIEDLVFEEMIIFARTANRRHIPLLTDGMKDAYRKIVYTALKRSAAKKIGIEEFAADVKKTTKYRHGPDSLREVCISAGQDFPGSNNIPYLIIERGAGSRIAKGADHVAPRYLHCKPSSILRKMFRKEDDVLLEPELEDGKEVCVKNYLPVLPLQLINYCSGIGWGWRSDSVQYNPVQLVEWVHYFVQHIKDGKTNREFHPPELIPWWRGYKGILFKRIDRVWVNQGRYEDKGNTCYILDLPISMSGVKYEEFLTELVEKKIIREWKPIGTDPNTPQYRIEGYTEAFDSHKSLKLESIIREIHFTYMNDKSLPIEYVGGAKHVCAQFCKYRYEKYVKRKEIYLAKLIEDSKIERLRLSFVLDVVEGRLDIRGKNKAHYGPYMAEKGYPDSFLKMAYISFSEEKAEELRAEIAKLELEIERYRSTHPGDLWLQDLDELVAELEKLYPGQWEFPLKYGTKEC